MASSKQPAHRSPGEGGHPADSHDLIRVQGARVNNLKDVSVEIPKRRLTVFTGVSGSGKSSLVFGTIAAESQRLINETYSTFLQNFMPSMARPEVDVLEGLTTAIIVDQERMGANARSTVGTATDANAMLRVLWSRIGKPHIGSSNAFSFNIPTRKASGAMTVEKGKGERIVVRDVVYQGGMCARCEGMGRSRHRPEAALRRQQVAQRGRAHDSGLHDGRLARARSSRPRASTRTSRSASSRRRSCTTSSTRSRSRSRSRSMNLTLRGPDPADQEVVPVQGRRRAAAAHPRVRRARGHVHDLSRLQAARGSTRPRGRRRSGRSTSPTPARCRSATSPRGCAGSKEPSVAPLLAKLGHTLDSFVEIGLGYLSLDRPSGTLSGGEAQRTKMVSHLGSSLTDVTYVFDEPTIGLHPHDIQRMNDLLLRLRDKGNTVLVVEHKPEMIAIADHVVDLGPGAGTAGGEVVFEGTVEALRASETLTGRHLSDKASLKSTVRKPTGVMKVTRRPHAQPQERQRGHPARRARGGDRRGRVGQELADSRLGVRPRRRGDGRPGRRSADRGGAIRRRTPVCSIRSAPRSRRPTTSSPRSSARTPRARVRPATAPA